MKLKQSYEKATAEVTLFDNSDIVTTSFTENGNYPEDGNDHQYGDNDDDDDVVVVPGGGSGGHRPHGCPFGWYAWCYIGLTR